jgi:hypothetical protein
VSSDIVAEPVSSQQLVLLDVSYIHEGTYDAGTRAFSPVDLPAGLPSDLTSPVNYAEGTLHQRLEVISKPVFFDVQYQLCLSQDDSLTSVKDEQTPERQTCSNPAGLRFLRPGVYTYSQPMASLLHHDLIDWRRGSDLVTAVLVIRDSAGNPIDNREGHAGQWIGSPAFSLYYPMRVHYTAVIVPAGEDFAGWP